MIWHLLPQKHWRMNCLIGLLSLWALIIPTITDADNLIDGEIRKLCHNGGLLLADDHGIIFQHNPDSHFIPASIIKIATSLTALTILGPDYRFPTDFHLDPQHNLHIKGYGDPFLTSEEISVIIKELKTRQVLTINNIVLDTSPYSLNSKKGPENHSLNPYDAANNALNANFNTVFLEKLDDGSIKSAEDQTPTLAMMKAMGQNLKPGRHRINISTNREDIIKHFGELFRALLTRAGVKGNGDIKNGIMPAGAQPVYRHYSRKTVREMINPLLLYSNNFIANQLFLAAGAKEHGLPATWQKARKTMTDFLMDIGLDRDSFTLVEGSGLSRQNKFSPRAILTILNLFKANSSLLPLTDSALIKSGTMQGVYSYAGYLKQNHQLKPFVIILNQPDNNRDNILRRFKTISNRTRAISPNNESNWE